MSAVLYKIQATPGTKKDKATFGMRQHSSQPHCTQKNCMLRQGPATPYGGGRILARRNINAGDSLRQL